MRLAKLDELANKGEMRGLSTPSSLRATLSEPDVKLGSLTFIRHKMTLSHFSKGLIHPVSGGEWLER